MTVNVDGRCSKELTLPKEYNKESFLRQGCSGLQGESEEQKRRVSSRRALLVFLREAGMFEDQLQKIYSN